MCQYNASISESRRLAPLCKEDFPMVRRVSKLMIKYKYYNLFIQFEKPCLYFVIKITKCAAAGRDHLPCCIRRGVPVECQALCQGTQLHSQNSVYSDCNAYIGNIMTCLEEGKNDITIERFHSLPICK